MMWAGRMRGGVPLVVLAGSGGQHAGGLGPLPSVGGGGGGCSAGVRVDLCQRCNYFSF